MFCADIDTLSLKFTCMHSHTERDVSFVRLSFFLCLLLLLNVMCFPVSVSVSFAHLHAYTCTVRKLQPGYTIITVAFLGPTEWTHTRTRQQGTYERVCYAYTTTNKAMLLFLFLPAFATLVSMTTIRLDWRSAEIERARVRDREKKSVLCVYKK